MAPGPAVHLVWNGVERFDLALPNGGTQTVDASRFSGSSTIDGRGGRDILIGGPGEDFLTGGSGNDEIDGGGGFDYVRGGPGDDLLRLRDGGVDRGLCGAGTDTVVADAGDLLTDCEVTDLPPVVVDTRPAVVIPPPPPLGDRTASKLKFTKVQLKGKTLRFTVACPAVEAHCSGKAPLKVTGKRGKKRATVSLGTTSFTLAGGKSKTVKKTLSARQRKAVRRLRSTKLALRVAVSDAAGNRLSQSASLSFKLRR